MNKYSITTNGTRIERVHKSTARKMFAAGYKLAIFGSNAHPESPWNSPFWVSKKDGELDSLVNGFEFYLPPELGRRAAFYARPESIQAYKKRQGKRKKTRR